MVFMFGENLRETVRLFDCFRRLRRLVMLDVAQSAGIENIRAHPELLGRFFGDRHLIAGNHLDADAHIACARDGCFGLLACRIEYRQYTNDLPLACFLCPRHAQRTEAASSKLVDRFLDTGFYLAGVGRHLENYVRGAFGYIELLAVRTFHRGYSALVHRVERLEMDHLIALQGL